MKKICFLLLLCLLTPSLWGQLQITAQVDKTNLTLSDELTLTIHINGGSGVRPQLPSLPAFNVYSQLQSSSFINGRTQHEFRYVMMPRMVGNTTIGPVTVDYQGKTYRTNPINIHIYRDDPGTPQPSSSQATSTAVTQYDSVPSSAVQDNTLPPLERSLNAQAAQRGKKEAFFIVSAVSNSHPYVGQTFTMAWRFYYSQPFPDNSPYQPPSVSNLLMDDLGKNEGIQNIGGTTFRYFEMRYQLSGAAAGEAIIGSARIELGNSPFDWFDRIFGGVPQSGPRTFESTPIRLDIQPIPTENKPASFYGAVGAGFTMSAAVDRTTLEAGDSVNLVLSVTGPGTLKSTRDFSFPEFTGFKSYPVASTFTPGKRSVKIFKTVLVPSASGIYTLEPMDWSYFDPVTQQYKTLQSNPIVLTVTPSSTANRSVDFGAQAAAGTGFQSLGSDIHYLKSSLAPKPSFLARLSRGIWINGLAAALLLLGILTRLLGKKINTKQAYSQAKTRLHHATSYEQISEALRDYLSQRLHIQTGSLPLKEVITALHKRGYTPQQTDPFTQLWKQLEDLRFAPGASSQAQKEQIRQLACDAQEVIKQLEEKIK